MEQKIYTRTDFGKKKNKNKNFELLSLLRRRFKNYSKSRGSVIFFLIKEKRIWFDFDLSLSIFVRIFAHPPPFIPVLSLSFWYNTGWNYLISWSDTVVPRQRPRRMKFRTKTCHQYSIIGRREQERAPIPCTRFYTR